MSAISFLNEKLPCGRYLPIWAIGSTLSAFLLSTSLSAEGAGRQAGSDSRSPASSTINPFRAKSEELTIAGFPPETPVSIQLPDGSRFKVPAAYLMPWPVLREFFGKTNHWPRFSFAFWMPDKRYLEKNPFFTGGYRPTEKGRPAPTFDQYVIFANPVSIVTQETRHKYVFPDQQLANIKYNPSYNNEIHPLLTEKIEKYYGITELITHDDYEYNWLYNDFSSDIQIFMRCYKNPSEVLDPSCSGDAYFKNSNLFVSFSFTQSQLARWRENLSEIEKFVLKWKE